MGVAGQTDSTHRRPGICILTSGQVSFPQVAIKVCVAEPAQNRAGFSHVQGPGRSRRCRRPACRNGDVPGFDSRLVPHHHGGVMSQGRRRSPLPQGWGNKRGRVLRRDGYRCTWNTTHPDGRWVGNDGREISTEEMPRAADYPERCTAPARDVDHIDGDDDHTPGNLRSLCGTHHDKRTAKQARAASPAFPRKTRPAPRHPGLTR